MQIMTTTATTTGRHRSALQQNITPRAFTPGFDSSQAAGYHPGEYLLAVTATPSEKMGTLGKAWGQVKVRLSDSVRSKDWVGNFDADLAGKHRQARETRLAYIRRIEELRKYGDEDGLDVNAASEKDFRAFISTMPTACPAGLVLMDNGNLRAVWDDPDDADSHLALQFRGGRQVQYVIFKRRPAASKVSRATGTDTFMGIKHQIAAFGLKRLVYS